MYQCHCFTNRGIPLAVLLLFTEILLLSGCGRKQPSADTESIDSSDVYTLEVIKDRKQKDLYFLADENSPLKASDRDDFLGLPYFKPDREFAFEAVLRRLPQPEEIVMATSKDRPRQMWYIGDLPFAYRGSTHRLRVFAPKDTSDGNYWFIPFTDETNGRETYRGGRYIDIDGPVGDTTFLDFNYAYNPYCAYNDRYDCPIPPRENRLSIAIRAGEKYERR